MAGAPSLFDAPPGPVLSSAAGWVTGTLFGDVAAALCVLAVAFVGLMLMSGRLAVRDGVRVVIACFVLLGAPLIAAGLRSTADETTRAVSPAQPAIETYSQPAPVP